MTFLVEVFAYSSAHIAKIGNDILFMGSSPRATGQGRIPASTRHGREAGGFFQNSRSIMSIITVNDASPAGSSISVDPPRS
jgi:hypothetical protein